MPVAPPDPCNALAAQRNRQTECDLPVTSKDSTHDCGFQRTRGSTPRKQDKTVFTDERKEEEGREERERAQVGSKKKEESLKTPPEQVARHRQKKKVEGHRRVMD